MEFLKKIPEILDSWNLQRNLSWKISERWNMDPHISLLESSFTIFARYLPFVGIQAIKKK